MDEISSIYALLAEGSTQKLTDLVDAKCKKLGLSPTQFCNILDIETKTWRNIAKGDQQKIDISIFIKLSDFLGLDVRELIQLHLANATVEEIRKLEKSRRHSYLINNFDLKQLKKIGFLQNITDLEYIEDRIKGFFQLEKITDYECDQPAPAYSRTALPISEKMLKFWNKVVSDQLENHHNPYPYDEKKLLSVIPKMRSATLDVRRGFSMFRKALYECGLTVIVETYLPKIGIRGGTFFVNGRPAVVLTNFRESYATLWFALGHELHHVISDMDSISREGYHLSGEETLFANQLMETLANEFSRRLLITDENLAFIEKYINTNELVERYAQQWGVHPSIIYSFYLYGKPKELYKRYSDYLIKSHEAIRNIEVKNPWQNQTIAESQTKINESLSEMATRPAAASQENRN